MTDRDASTDRRLVLGGPFPPLLADPIVAAVLILLLVSLFFHFFPAVDIWFSRLFYDPALGFPISRLGAFNGLRIAEDWLFKLTVVLLIVALLVKLLRPRKPAPVPLSKVLFLLASLAIGPGLIVNLVLKDGWGRPRPRMVDLFGGGMPFVPVWRMSDYCASNCSFASGEASTAIWFVALALVAPAPWRKTIAITAVGVAIVASLNRIAFGAHFLSDVLVAWCLTLLVIAILYRVMIENPPAWLQNDALEARGTAFGEKLRKAFGSKRP